MYIKHIKRRYTVAKQGDIEHVRNEMVKLSKVIEQYYETGDIYYHDIQELKKINKESSILFSVLLLISILLGIIAFQIGTTLWAVVIQGMAFTLYLMFQLDRLVSILNLPEARDKESWDNLEVELKQLRGFMDLEWRINRYHTLHEEVTHVLKQADELALEEDSKITDILNGFIKLTGKLNS